MRDFLIVTIVLLLFLGLGIGMGALIIAVLPRRRGPKRPGGEPPESPEDDERPPRWPGG